MSQINYTHIESKLHSRLKIDLFQGVRNANPEIRKETLEKIKNIFVSWANEVSDSKIATPPTSEITPSNDPNNDAKKALELHILTIFRMSMNCPFVDVRHAFTELLGKLKEWGVPTPSPIYPYPSLYIQPKEILTLEWPENDEPYDTPTSPGKLIGIIPDENVRNLMSTTFINIGRLSNYYRTLFYFPSFAEKYQRAYNELVRSDGVLPNNYRYYIGIMAASRHKCQYLVSHLKNEYLSCGGDPEWLNGLERAPAKLRKIDKINSILAHQPWRIKPEDIKDLLTGSPSSDNWSTNEVVHLIVLLSTFHSLSSYVLSCGVVPEYDSDGGFKRPSSWTTPSSDHEEKEIPVNLNSAEHASDMGSGLGIYNNNKQVIERLKEEEEKKKSHEPPKDDSVAESSEDDPVGGKSGELPKEGSVMKESQDPPKDALAEEESKDDEVDEEYVGCEEETSPKIPVTEETPAPTQTPPPLIDPFTKDFPLYLSSGMEVPYPSRVFSRDDYRKRLHLKKSELTWEVDGISIVEKYLQIGENNPHDRLDEEFKEIQAADYKLFSSESELDTLPFRDAIRYYIYRLYGIHEDWYKYGTIGIYLNNNEIKNFIKKVCTRPEDFTLKDWNNMGFEMSAREKCYIILICVETRKRAELLHGLWSVAEAFSM